MYENIDLFDFITNDETLIREFNRFWHIYGLMPALSNANRVPNIKISDNDARSVVNPGGSFNRTLLEFANVLSINNYSNHYEVSLGKALEIANGSLQKYINVIRKHILPVIEDGETEEEAKWRVVWYAHLKDL